MDALRREKHYTYDDYCAWDDGQRWELIDGVPYAMAPAPLPIHQTVLGEIYFQLRSYLEGKPCKVFVAPLDVRLNADADDDTVVQPDILVICDDSKLDGKSCVGAPDMVIEILSPSTSRHDRLVKTRLYQKYSVREYWIVDPETESIQANILDEGRFYITIYTDTDKAPVHVLEGCTIDLAKVFTD